MEEWEMIVYSLQLIDCINIVLHTQIMSITNNDFC